MRAVVRFASTSADAGVFVTEITITVAAVPPGDPAMPGDVTVLGLSHAEAIGMLHHAASVLQGGRR